MVTVAQIEESADSRGNIPENAPSDEEDQVIVPNMAPSVFEEEGKQPSMHHKNSTSRQTIALDLHS